VTVFLADTDVLSEPTKPTPHGSVINWLAVHDAELATSPVILGELEYGILSLPSGRRRERLHDWFSNGVCRLRNFDIDARTAAEWSHLLADLRRRGRRMPVKDSLIAATARQHGLTLATRNTADYEFAGVDIVNPFDL
jgi:toxin FitB